MALEAGDTPTVTLTLDMRSLAYFDDMAQEWIPEAGDFDLLIGQNNADLPLKLRLTLADHWKEPTT